MVVIGGGAAGLFCAAEAGRRGRRVALLEHNASVGRKIRISGGGRCNFTNLHTSPANFISANPHFGKSALARYTPADFVALVEKHGINYYEKKLGQLFCRGSAQQIIDMLVAECEAAGVEIKLSCRVQGITKDDAFTVETNQGALRGESVVIATGGLSIPALGSTDFGHRVARQFGLKVRHLRPALVPLVLGHDALAALKPLSGVSFDAAASCGGASFRESVLITHRGLSGPAILQASSYWNEGEAVTIDLLPGADAAGLLASARSRDAELANALGGFLPRRLARAWCDSFAPPKPLKQYTERELFDTAAKLHEWAVVPAGTEGYAKAEVTAGGVDTNELSSKTMESKKVPGLFFVGEVVDVTGHLGGFNFQWAWASGYAAGQYV